MANSKRLQNLKEMVRECAARSQFREAREG
jgi:hypothetical protein